VEGRKSGGRLTFREIWNIIIYGVGNMNVNQIETLLKDLPGPLQHEVIDYIEFLIHKYKLKSPGIEKFDFSWEGGLKDIKDKYNSVELQHKALQWR
jgi:hypothetical protein